MGQIVKSLKGCVAKHEGPTKISQKHLKQYLAPSFWMFVVEGFCLNTRVWTPEKTQKHNSPEKNRKKNTWTSRLSDPAGSAGASACILGLLGVGGAQGDPGRLLKWLWRLETHICHVMNIIYIYIYYTVHMIYVSCICRNDHTTIVISYSMYAYTFIYIFFAFVILIYLSPPCTWEAVFTKKRIFFPYMKLTQSFENDVWKMAFLLGWIFFQVLCWFQGGYNSKLCQRVICGFMMTWHKECYGNKHPHQKCFLGQRTWSCYKNHCLLAISCSKPL